MLKKFIIPGVAVILMITLFVMYRNEHRLYEKALQANYSLSAHLREVQQKNQQVTEGMEQIQQATQYSAQTKGTFVDQKKYYRQHWQNYIHVSLNNYKTGLLGGVHDIKVIVTNDSEFPLDNVVASVQYYRANGKLFKTETVDVNNIKAKSSSGASAPDSRKGMSVKLVLNRITSQQMNFCWSPDKKTAPGDMDPYACVPNAQ
jgi:hypothetical protein